MRLSRRRTAVFGLLACAALLLWLAWHDASDVHAFDAEQQSFPELRVVDERSNTSRGQAEPAITLVDFDEQGVTMLSNADIDVQLRYNAVGALAMDFVRFAATDETVVVIKGVLFELQTDAGLYTELKPDTVYSVTDGVVAEFSIVHIMKLTWRIELLRNKHYVRIFLTIAPLKNVIVHSVTLLDLMVHGDGPVGVVGSVEGSPVLLGSFFAGIEFPMAGSEIDEDRKEARCYMKYGPKGMAVTPAEALTVSAVVGYYGKPLQLRRSFQAYLEDTRASAYHMLLHYNSWYEFRRPGLFGLPQERAMTEDNVLASITTTLRELHGIRGVKVDSFLLDDGWDDWQSLWSFHEHFPSGFSNIAKATTK